MMLTARAAMLDGVSPGESRKRCETSKACTMESHGEGVANHTSSESLRQARDRPTGALGKRYGPEMRRRAQQKRKKEKKQKKEGTRRAHGFNARQAHSRKN